MNEKLLKYIHSNSFNDCPVLDIRQKNVIIKRIIDKSTYVEIANFIKRSPPQAKNIFNRAIELLGFYIEEKTSFLLIQDSALSHRIKYCLNNISEIKCIKDLDGYCAEKLKFMRNLGQGSINEIQDYIKELGFSLKFKDQKKEKKFNDKDIKELSEEDILKLIIKLVAHLQNRKNHLSSHPDRI